MKAGKERWHLKMQHMPKMQEAIWGCTNPIRARQVTVKQVSAKPIVPVDGLITQLTSSNLHQPFLTMNLSLMQTAASHQTGPGAGKSAPESHPV